MTDVKTPKLRAISKMCRAVLMLKNLPARESNLRFLGAQEMAEEVLKIIKEKQR